MIQWLWIQRIVSYVAFLAATDPSEATAKKEGRKKEGMTFSSSSTCVIKKKKQISWVGRLSEDGSVAMMEYNSVRDLFRSDC
jgi:hypothetical protein